MNDPKVRASVRLYLAGELTEPEAARRAGLSRSMLRYYTRTSGLVAPSPIESSDGPERLIRPDSGT